MIDGANIPAAKQSSIRRMREFGITPKRDLGQNFLVDDNILGVITSLAKLTSDDVALEVGGGLGVLSEHLAPLVGALHVVEMDKSLEEPLLEALAPFKGAQLHLGDAVKINLGNFDPQPTAVVANLPYSVAATVILKTVVECSQATRWVAMVQKEVGQRFAAEAGSKQYGAPSALAQLSCDVKVLRPISRQVFAPVPNVDSVLVGLTRVRPPAPKPVRTLINAGFKHRRKAFAKSVELSLGSQEFSKSAVIDALEALDLRTDVRAERLKAKDFAEVAAHCLQMSQSGLADEVAGWLKSAEASW